jgi:hypothetical protein
VRLIFRPIDTWPGKHTNPRKPSPFDPHTNWSSTLTMLEKELRALHVQEAVLQVDSPNERDFRLDGQLRSDTKLRSPAVILSFETRRHGKLSYPCDTFDKKWSGQRLEGWQANVRAIALGLEALRRVDRYGIANTGQQYTGWKQLGAGLAMPPATMTVEEAARFIAKHAELPLLGIDDVPWEQLIIEDRPGRAQAYRQAAKRLHPDAGGNADDFRRLTEAFELLEALR